jgi:Tol biopolymer transport system component
MIRNLEQKQQLIFRMILIGFFVFISLLIYLLFFIRGKVTVEVVPTSAVVTLDNQPGNFSGGSVSFLASLGKHTLKVEAADYVGYKEEINLRRGKNYSKKNALEKSPSPVELAGSASDIAIKGNEIFYKNTSDGLFYLATIDYAGKEAKITGTKKITSTPVTNSDKVIWSPTKELILLKKGSSVSLLDFKKYDFVNQNVVHFSDNVGDIVWAPDNSRIAYYYAPPSGERSIIFSNATNSTVYRAANLASLRINDPYIAFSPDSQWLVVIPRNSTYDQNVIYLLNVYTKEMKVLNSDGNQKEAIFSADSKRVIFSTYDTASSGAVKRKVGVIDLDGSNKKYFSLAANTSFGRYWKETNKIFLPIVDGGSKLVLVDIDDGKTNDFYFNGQRNLKIDDIYLNDGNTGAIFTSGGKLYFVKLEGNG